VGLAGGAVLTLAAGSDLLCLGPLPTYDDVQAIIAEIVSAVREGRLPESRLEEAAARVAALRSWAAAPARTAAVGAAGAVADDLDSADQNSTGQNGAGQNGTEQNGTEQNDAEQSVAEQKVVGLHAARRAVRLTGSAAPLVEPLVIEVDTPPTIAVGDVPWGVGPWLPDAEILRVKPAAADVPGLLAKADGRSLVVVVKDAHRHHESQDLVSALVSARPDTTVIEMGLPVWRPDSAAYIATYGAARANAQAAVELLTA
jgi:beta-N-acetylhexosaminidase